MARPRLHPSPDAALEARRAATRAGVARHKEKMDSLTRLEQAAWKARASLGEDHDPYTAPERAEAEAIRADMERLAARAEGLNRRLKARLERSQGQPGHDVLLASLDGKGHRVDLPPF